MTAPIILIGCHVYNEEYACVPVVENPRGGVTVRNCAWLHDDDAGLCDDDDDAGAEQ